MIYDVEEQRANIYAEDISLAAGVSSLWHSSDMSVLIR